VLQPVADQSGLAEAGRSTDEGQLAGQALIQSLNQASAWDEVDPCLRVGAGKGDKELGLQQGLVHVVEYTSPQMG
jgi:hypothetical protein